MTREQRKRASLKARIARLRAALYAAEEHDMDRIHGELIWLEVRLWMKEAGL